VDEGVMRDVVSPGRQLFLVRQLAKENQVRDFQKVTSLRELFDRVAAVFQDPLVAVNEGDRAFSGRGVHQRGIVGHQPEIVRIRFDLAQIHRAHRSILNWQRVGSAGAIVRNR
jgi:hypothetical protein